MSRILERELWIIVLVFIVLFQTINTLHIQRQRNDAMKIAIRATKDYGALVDKVTKEKNDYECGCHLGNGGTDFTGDFPLNQPLKN